MPQKPMNHFCMDQGKLVFILVRPRIFQMNDLLMVLNVSDQNSLIYCDISYEVNTRRLLCDVKILMLNQSVLHDKILMLK